MFKAKENTVIADRKQRYNILSDIYTDVPNDKREKIIQDHIRLSNERSREARKTINSWISQLIDFGLEYETRSLYGHILEFPLKKHEYMDIHGITEIGLFYRTGKIRCSISHRYWGNQCAFQVFEFAPNSVKDVITAVKYIRSNVKILKKRKSIMYGIHFPFKVIVDGDKLMAHDLGSKELREIKNKGDE